MRFVIVTGMSGAGKSSALKTLEDAGYFCVDNLPVALLDKFADMLLDETAKIENVALGIDIRNGGGIGELAYKLKEIEAAGIKYEILYLNASNRILLKRYKETRRNHPANAGRTAISPAVHPSFRRDVAGRGKDSLLATGRKYNPAVPGITATFRRHVCPKSDYPDAFAEHSQHTNPRERTKSAVGTGEQSLAPTGRSLYPTSRPAEIGKRKRRTKT